MKKRLALTVLTISAALLSACAAKGQTAWETVDDDMTAQCAMWQEGAKRISFDVPQDAVLQSASEDGTRQLYAAQDGGYEIACEVLLDASAEGALRSITGFSSDQVEMVQTSKDGRSEYRFAWYVAGDEGGRLCRADAVLDAPYCYVLLFSSSEQSGSKYDSIADAVFASMALLEPDMLQGG